MKIFWKFYYTSPGEKDFCEAFLKTSISDDDFSFNLRAPKTSVDASKSFMSGAQANELSIRSYPGQSIILFIRDNNGNQEMLSFNVDDYWIGEEDIRSTQTPVDYKKLFRKK